MSKHINIPVFIPHIGCPNNCVFCNQHKITGKGELADRNIREEIENALSTYEGCPENAEIAFFGGSFTGIDRSEMKELLKTAYDYVKSGRVNSIRLSTRPDYISREILDILKEYGVTDIELGIQSMSDKVLAASKRGHTSEQTRKACALIKEYGFTLVGQMMVGLPGACISDELFTAREIIKMGCDGTRIYPTVVFQETELCDMAKSGIYTPITVQEAVERSAGVYEVFADAGIQILRIGLQSTEELVSGKGVYAGANHPSLGELVIGEYYFKKMRTEIPEILKPGENILTIICAPGEQSKVAGQKKHNKTRLLEEFKNIKNIKIVTNQDVQQNMLEYTIN